MVIPQVNEPISGLNLLPAARAKPNRLPVPVFDLAAKTAHRMRPAPAAPHPAQSLRMRLVRQHMVRQGIRNPTPGSSWFWPCRIRARDFMLGTNCLGGRETPVTLMSNFVRYFKRICSYGCNLAAQP